MVCLTLLKAKLAYYSKKLGDLLRQKSDYVRQAITQTPHIDAHYP